MLGVVPTLPELLIILTAFAAVTAWFVAAASAMRLLGYRAPHVTLADLAFRGAAFFDPDNFRPEAAPLLRRFRRAFFSFFGAVFMGSALSMLFVRRS